MTPAFWAIIGVGVSLGGLNVALSVASFQMINKRIDDTNRRIDGLASDVRQLTARATELEKGQAGMAGLLDGLREALFERARS